MPIELLRTFSSASDSLDDGEQDWSDYLGATKERQTWEHLKHNPLVVILGEAGIGKTIEFALEAKRLRGSGTLAFSVALNQLVDSESWELALADSFQGFEAWKTSKEVAYFFLDAVDEARIRSHADFVKALSVVNKALRESFNRVHIVISSRPTDWSIESVKATVEAQLSKPIAAARSKPTEILKSSGGENSATVNIDRLIRTTEIEPIVVSLDPLSISEAKRLANEFGVQDAGAFWNAVEDGSYEFMATRPLDLDWMVRLWNEKRSLGTYCELIESNVRNRLAEQNPSYLAAGVALSHEQLRSGAEALAAATELCDRTSVATEYLPSFKAKEVDPFSVLSDWKPNEVARLLSTAIFDEATFGRVRFHHRATRGYLAACWVSRQLVIGVPFHRVLRLFSTSIYGATILIPGRRWTLCWLAAINIETREWLIRNFPEMLLFDGDPEAWDAASADRAFLAFAQRLKDGFRVDWFNAASEYRRVGRRLSPGLLAGLLATPELPSRVTTAMLPVVQHGHLKDCADAVFRIYKKTSATERERRYALEVLATIGKTKQREAILADLLSGRLKSNSLIAAALPAIDWQQLSVTQLTTVFFKTRSEDGYGGGPMAQAFKEELIPKTTAASSSVLLRAVLAALPAPKAGKRFNRFSDSDQPERAWLLYVLPNCLERLLALLPVTHSEYIEVCVEAIERLEALRDSGFVEREELNRIHDLLAERHELRWRVALEIAQSEDVRFATSRLTWGSHCLVSIGVNDIPELIFRANDVASSHEVRDIWFAVGMEVGLRSLRGRDRAHAFAKLAEGSTSEARKKLIATQRKNLADGRKQSRKWDVEQAVEMRKRHAQHEASRNHLLGDITNIRSANNRGSLHWLIQYSYENSGHKSFTRVDYEVIAKDFGQALADALAIGLKAVWATAETPNPADYKDGTLPWEGLAALAGFHTLLDEGHNLATLPDIDTVKAAKLAVWELNGPPSWFEPLARAHAHTVAEALRPWIEDEVQHTQDSHRSRNVLEMVFRCSNEVRAALLATLIPMIPKMQSDRSALLKRVAQGLRSGGLISTRAVINICRSEVVASISSNGLIGEMHWLRTWLEEDASSAWNWFEKHVQKSPAIARDLVKAFAKMAEDYRWVEVSEKSVSVDVLLRLHQLLTRHQPAPAAQVDPDDRGPFGSIMAQLRSSIPNVLVQSRGAAAHHALVQLMEAETIPSSKQWLASKIEEHSAIEAAHSSQLDPSHLRDIGSMFITSPKSEAQLFAQVLARLEEVRNGTEEGPFSDRSLFRPGMPEAHLQSWLAARFWETKNLRFTVSREEQVDNDKKPDIQLGCPQGKVCVEIKPLYKGCGYSAASLTDTLRTQIAGQYLRGNNSAHGVLVLFNLDDKSWDIPEGKKRQSFSALVDYLQAQANTITLKSKRVAALQVVGINCVSPDK